MRRGIWILLCLIGCGAGRAAAGPVLPATEPELVRTIATSGSSCTTLELTRLVEACSEYPASAEISAALTGWLRENHPVYAGKTPTEANQFRVYLLAALGKFRPSPQLSQYVKSELLFTGHPFNIAAAASTARSFPEEAAELVPLLEPFLDPSYQDEWVDISTPQLDYPIVNPTRARHEIIETLKSFGAPAYRSVRLLDEIAACENCGTFGRDALLPLMARAAAEHLRTITPPCCRRESSSPKKRGLVLIDKKLRKNLSTASLKLIDQDEQALKFSDFAGRPFVLTFFYTQCPNALKCVSTVQRLGQLVSQCGLGNLAGKVAIFGMTYDPYFDGSSILKMYGNRYGIRFSEDVKFLKAVDNSDAALRDQLQLRVSYGAGSVNQHGVQLFVFDKRGRLAAINDNEMWSVPDVESCLLALVNE